MFDNNVLWITLGQGTYLWSVSFFANPFQAKFHSWKTYVLDRGRAYAMSTVKIWPIIYIIMHAVWDRM